jgi:hypothetical protein
MTTTETLEQANEALRTAVETRLGCAPAAAAVTAAIEGACCEGTRMKGPSAAEVVERFSPTHPTSQRFYELCDRLKKLHASKSTDYGCPSGTDPLANIRNGAAFVGIPSWQGAMVRLSDKVTRLATFNRTGSLTFEGVEDNLLDLASYALLAFLLYEEEHGA